MFSPDLFFLGGLIILGLAFPAAVAAFSSSNGSIKPVFFCILLGGGMLTYAMMNNTNGYSLADVPRIALSLVR